MLKLYPTLLRNIFTSGITETDDVVMWEGNPFILQIGNKSYVIFLKSISPAYFSGSPDISRIQMPIIEHEGIKKGYPLIVLGYDSDNNCFVGWNPLRIKNRLNSRNNVSLYSRISIQNLADKNKINKGRLSTGEVFFAFEPQLLKYFILNIEKIFSEDDLEIINSHSQVKATEESDENNDRIFEITEKEVIEEIMPLLKETRVLDAASVCYNHYGKKFPAMTLVDWLKFATNMLNKMESTI